MAATSVLSLHALAGEPRLDANQDGVINFPDLSAALESSDFNRVNAVLSNWGLRVVLPVGAPTNPPPPPPEGITPSKKPVARWVDVPFRTVDQPYRLRVVAEDISGILAVSFNANQGSTVFVTEPIWSDETAGYEYTALLDPADIDVGERIQISAVVYPNSGPPRVLAGPLNSASAASGEFSMVVFGPPVQVATRYVSVGGNDTTGTGAKSNPYRTIDRAMYDVEDIGAGDQMFIYLESGSHGWGGPRVDAPNDRWLTIVPAPGVSAGSVRIVSGTSTRVGAPRVRLANVTLDQRSAWNMTGYNTVDDSLWLDSVVCIGPGRWTNSGTVQSEPVLASNIASYFVTNSSASNYINGFRAATLVRNSSLSRLGADAYSNTRLVLNCTVDDIDNGTHAYHPDVYQFSGSGTRDNTFIRGLTATNAQCQGVFSNGLAVVANTYLGNIRIERNMPDPSVPPWSMWAVDETNHFLIDELALPDSTWSWRCPIMNNVRISGFDVYRQVVQTVGVWEEDWFVD